MAAETKTWRATVLTLFPEMFPGPLGVSLAGKALASGLWALEARDIRSSATDRHRSVDDTPAGGGPGMVLRADVLAAAIDAADIATDCPKDRPRLLMSPRGRPLTQSRVMELALGPGPLIVCGRFEGIDQRVIDARRLEEVSVGDYVLSGGEIAAMALIDACVRLLPGVMGKPASGADESFSDGLLEYPQYTRPQEFGRGRGPDPGAAARSLGGQNHRPKTPKKPDGRVTSRCLCRIRAPNPRNGRITGHSRSPRWARRRWRFCDEPHSRARKRAIRKTVRRQNHSGIRTGRYRDRQRQGGRRRPLARAGL
jgi:tRNA (guanine37-N1)-methyltransferase